MRIRARHETRDKGCVMFGGRRGEKSEGVSESVSTVDGRKGKPLWRKVAIQVLDNATYTSLLQYYYTRLKPNLLHS